MAVLHLLANPAAVASCLPALADDDSLLLCGEGALALPLVVAAAPKARLGVLADAAATFGVAADSATPLSYADFVAWVIACDRSVTWT